MTLGWSSRPADVLAELPISDLREATVLITGPTSGVGEQAALAFASLGCHLVLAARNEDKVKHFLQKHGLDGNAKVSFIQCDLNSLDSVDACATSFLAKQAALPPLKVLVLNAGVYNFSGGYKASADGYESTFAVNHLAHFLLTMKLMPALEAAAPARVVVVGSGSQFGPLVTKHVEDAEAVRALATPAVRHQRTFWHGASACAYGSSKLCNTMLARSLHLKYHEKGKNGKGVTACSLHPGTLMRSNMAHESAIADFVLRRVLSWFTKDLEQGASTTLYCSLAPHESLKGDFFSDCQRVKMSKLATDKACEVLWDVSCDLCKGRL